MQSMGEVRHRALHLVGTEPSEPETPRDHDPDKLERTFAVAAAAVHEVLLSAQVGTFPDLTMLGDRFAKAGLYDPGEVHSPTPVPLLVEAFEELKVQNELVRQERIAREITEGQYPNVRMLPTSSRPPLGDYDPAA